MSRTLEVMRHLEALGTVVVTGIGSRFKAMPSDSQGFELELIRDTSEFTVLFLGAHQHFDTEDEALRFFVYLLSDHCRLVVIMRGGAAHKWIVELLEDGIWCARFTLGTLFFPFWRSKSQRIHQNHAVKDPESVLAVT